LGRAHGGCGGDIRAPASGPPAIADPRRGGPGAFLALLLLSAAVTAAASRGEAPADRPQAIWREGPVRYIITTEEDREFRRLREDEDRLRFIERFWYRRDPEPRTLVNEYRHEFWTRVATANKLFTESTKPGWKTDMGRYYILLGPPDDRDTTQEMSGGPGRAGVRGSIKWIYSHAPTPRVGTGTVIVFTKDPSGEFHAETDPRIVERLLGSTILGDAPETTFLGVPLPPLAPQLTELQLMLDLGRLEEVPSEDDLLTATVTAEEFFGLIPFSARYDFFARGDLETIVAITLNIHPDPLEPLRRSAPPEYLMVGRIEPEPTAGGGAGKPVFLREPDFSPSGHNLDPQYHGPYIYQSVATMPPGRYRVSFAAFDRLTRKIGSYTDVLEVPSFAEGSLALSSLCLSESIEPVSSDTGRAAPYVIGHLKVTPRLIPAYRNGDTFAVYYHVYSALTDPATHTPNLQIEYQFLVGQAGVYIPIGRPIRFESVGNSAQGWSFPLRDWPAADFKLRVTVTDSLTGQTASREVAFKVL
jgi:GWxTD domain-containing protein